MSTTTTTTTMGRTSAPTRVKKSKKKRIELARKKRLVEERRQVLLARLADAQHGRGREEENSGGGGGGKSRRGSASDRGEAAAEGGEGSNPFASTTGATAPHVDVNAAVRRALEVEKSLEAAAEGAAAAPGNDGEASGPQEDAEESQRSSRSTKVGIIAKKKRSRVDSNWQSMKTELGAGTGKKRRRGSNSSRSDRTTQKTDTSAKRNTSSTSAPTGSNDQPKIDFAPPTKILAIDCEMVGVGADGLRNCLARVAVVNSRGEAVYHAYVKPEEEVVDYRTEFSGIRPHDVHSDHAVTFKEAQKKVADLIQHRVLVGHAVANDLNVLLLSHPRKLLRDTSRSALLRMRIGMPQKGRAVSLKRLTAEILGEEIQGGEHNPIEDAVMTMRLYLKVAKEWEANLAARFSTGGKHKSRNKHLSAEAGRPQQSFRNLRKPNRSFIEKMETRTLPTPAASNEKRWRREKDPVTSTFLQLPKSKQR